MWKMLLKSKNICHGHVYCRQRFYSIRDKIRIMQVSFIKYYKSLLKGFQHSYEHPFHLLNLGSVGKIACISETGNNVGMFVDDRVDGTGPECCYVTRKMVAYIIHRFLGGDD